MSIKLEKNGYIKTIPTATVNAHTRLSASCRLTIKEPYNKLYKRSLM